MQIKHLDECSTTAGAVATVAQPFETVQKRAPEKKLKGSNLLKGIKTSAKYANSLHESSQSPREKGYDDGNKTTSTNKNPFDKGSSDYTNYESGFEEGKSDWWEDEKVNEGAKVDRMVGHVKSSEKKLGKSSKEAENIAWATANKRGMLDNKNKKVEEGISDTIKRGVKSVKRGMQGWGELNDIPDDDPRLLPGAKDTPRQLVARNKGYDDKTVKQLARPVKSSFPFGGDDITSPHSPRGLQKRVLDREMKKRGMQEDSQFTTNDSDIRKKIKSQISKLTNLVIQAGNEGDQAKCDMYKKKIESLKQKIPPLPAAVAEGLGDYIGRKLQVKTTKGKPDPKNAPGWASALGQTPQGAWHWLEKDGPLETPDSDRYFPLSGKTEFTGFGSDYKDEQGVAEGDVVQFPQKHPWYAAKTCPKCEGSLVGGKTAEGRVKYCMGCGTVYPEPNTNKGVAEADDKKEWQKQNAKPKQLGKTEKYFSTRHTTKDTGAADKEQGVAEGSGGNWYIRVNGKILNDTKFKPMIFSSEDEARSYAMKLADKKRIPLSQIKLTKSWMDAPEQGVAEGSANEGREPMVGETCFIRNYNGHVVLQGLSGDKARVKFDNGRVETVSRKDLLPQSEKVNSLWEGKGEKPATKEKPNPYAKSNPDTLANKKNKKVYKKKPEHNDYAQSDPDADYDDNKIDEGRFVKGPGGVPLDRQGNAIPPKPQAEPKAPAVRRDANGLSRADYDVVWRKIEDVVGQIFPDGDPIDWLGPWLDRQGIKDYHGGEVLNKACRLNGYKDIYAYYDHFKTDDYGYEKPVREAQQAAPVMPTAAQADPAMPAPEEPETDPELRSAEQSANVHYSSAAKRNKSLEKFLLRSVKHAKEADTEQNIEIRKIKRDMDAIRQMASNRPVAEAGKKSGPINMVGPDKNKHVDVSANPSVAQSNDPELRRKTEWAQRHYGATLSPDEAMNKWMQRGLDITEKNDKRHDAEIAKLMKEIAGLKRIINNLHPHATGASNVAEGEITEDDVVLSADRRRPKSGLLSKPEQAMNPADVVKLDVPLLIRLLEFAKEDAADDMALHDLAEKLVAGCQRGRTLTMKDYDNLVPSPEAPAPDEEEQEDFEGKFNQEMDEISNPAVKSYLGKAMQDTITGKKDRNPGMKRAISRLAGTNKPLTK